MGILPSGTEMFNVQQAIYAVLQADSTLMGMVKGVYDGVPIGADFPYVVVGDAVETAENVLTHIGREVSVTIHIWSRYNGYKEATTILSQIVNDLDTTTLTWAGNSSWKCIYESGHVTRDPDGISRHAVGIFSVGVQI